MDISLNKIWWLCLVSTSATKFASDLGYRMAKKLIGLYKENTFMNNHIIFLSVEWRTRYSFTNFEDSFGLRASVIFLTPISVVAFIFVCLFDSKLLWWIGRTNCWYYYTRVDLYSHQILFRYPVIACFFNLGCFFNWTWDDLFSVEFNCIYYHPAFEYSNKVQTSPYFCHFMSIYIITQFDEDQVWCVL